jgi:hypothetical protein
MVSHALADKLLDVSRKHATEISELWHKAISTNSRTPSYNKLDKGTLVDQAASFYKNLKQLYFTEDAYPEVERFLAAMRYAEYAFENSVPLHEAVYALIIMRRHIWLFAEAQAILYNTPLEIYQALESVNRTILLFDYAIYIVTRRYDELARKK